VLSAQRSEDCEIYVTLVREGKSSHIVDGSLDDEERSLLRGFFLNLSCSVGLRGLDAALDNDPF
jgi:hypothetical protein